MVSLYRAAGIVQLIIILFIAGVAWSIDPVEAPSSSITITTSHQ